MVANDSMKGLNSEVQICIGVSKDSSEEPLLKPIQATAAYKNKSKVAYDLSQQYFNTLANWRL